MKITMITAAFFALSIIGCKEAKKDKMDANEGTAMQSDSTDMEQQKGDWTVLFDGKNLDGWHAYNGDAPTQWKVEDGALVLTPAENRSGPENLVSDKSYDDFELSMDWKISKGGNSGVIWAVQEDEKYHEPYQTGPEIQILDDTGHPDGKNGKSHQAGALYDMIGPSEMAKPAGEWNTCVITINHKENKGSVDLNGTRVVDFPVTGDKWEALVNDSKFADWEGFAEAEDGHIALQDHGHKVSFKNIKIKELN